ncbi:MAG: helix-hairpin-helix domain-containing protein [Minisyncoccia bacterium]
MFQVLNPMTKSTAILEILILMGISALLGYLLARSCKDNCCCGTSCDATAKAKPATPSVPKAVMSAPVVSASDDLKKIEGIGPAIEKLLNAEGIKTFAQLADAKVEKIKNILDAAGPQFQMHDGETWAEQARLARDGKWVEFKALTDKLQNGKHV